MLDLFPDSAGVESGELELGGVPASALAERFGTPLVVYCEATLRARAREAVGAVARDGVAVYGTKALPNVAVLRLLAEEGLGADVASTGELAFARAAGITGVKLVVHGNAKPDGLLREAAAEKAIVVLDSEDEAERAAAAKVRHVLVRVTLGIDADTHDAIRTGHQGSKFGLPPDRAVGLVRRGLELGLDVLGAHVHVGSQVADATSHVATIDLLAEMAARARDELGWAPRIVDVGGGFPVRHVPDEPSHRLADLAGAAVAAVRQAWSERRLPLAAVYIEPGRALVGPAGVTLYRVESVKRLPGVTWVAVDGGMSDNPRRALYGARYTALAATRADEAPTEQVSIAGQHCESGDVLVDSVTLPSPRRGDLLALPATGGYTLAMASNYNATPRPAAVLVRAGEARLIRRRETVADLLALEE
jgi:diaminopimelate decarboxylase